VNVDILMLLLCGFLARLIQAYITVGIDSVKNQVEEKI